MPLRGVGLCTYNRSYNLPKVMENLMNTLPADCKVVVADDGSTDRTVEILNPYRNKILLMRGVNQGVAANKNRALYALQDCSFICLLEDDLYPTCPGWFELYEDAAQLTDIHHFCRVQDKEVEETIPEFSEWMKGNNVTPIYGPSPRGDFTFITSKVLEKVGAFNPAFKGAGYAHGEWSERVFKAGLIPHPLKWIDLKEGRDALEQIGDTEGGRWLEDQKIIKAQLKHNARVLKKLRKSEYLHHPLVLS
jgi:glycosyltransferase involved in cell wall biosynthesis